ncbi:PadR family transcriptional regulator PadR [Lachnospiraceae bacterium PF1-21]|uniref:PadR family transcriptional regulator n=1 Tax=Ohessyouella blattaphilus TaxID=2949333 RepID=UPI003E1DCC54
MNVDKSLISGSTTMLLLNLLLEKDMYGYEMIDTLSQRSMNVFELKAGTLYPLLHQMEKENYLESYEKKVSNKTRKYYHLTTPGKQYLELKIKEWEIYVNAISSMLRQGGEVHEF